MFYTIDQIRGFTGYAKAVRGLALTMSKKTFVKCVDSGPKDYLPEALYPLILGDMPELRSQDFVMGRVMFSNLLNYKQNADKSPKLIANLALECDKFPERLVRDCNDDRIEQIWVPSKFVRDNLINNNVIPEKIQIIPHGYDPEIYKVDMKERERDYYRFMFNGGYTGRGDRKGADLLVEVFKEEFAKEIKEGKVMLYMKINASYGDASSDLEGAGIVIDKNFYMENKIAELLNKADCYVAPSAGEAFDMGTLEAMACGLPMIHNLIGGQTDYIFDIDEPQNRSILLDSHIVPARFSPWDIGNWHKPNKDSLKRAMRYMFETKPEVKKYANIENWTWDKAAEKACKCLL